MNKSSQKPAGPKLSASKKPSFNKENEGMLIPYRVTSREERQADGETTVHIVMDLDSAPAPRRKFVADAFSIIVRDRTCHMIFIQRQMDGEKFRAMIDIQVPEDAATSIAANFKYSKAPTLVATPVIISAEPPEQTVSLSAGFVRSASAASNCCIDFYYSSPFSTRLLQENSELYAEPEVRIVVSDFVYHGFIGELRKTFKMPELTRENSPTLAF